MKKLVLIIGLILGLSAMAENNTTKVNIKKAEETVKSDVKKDFEKIKGKADTKAEAAKVNLNKDFEKTSTKSGAAKVDLKKDVDGIDANIKKDYEAVKDKVDTKTDAAGSDVKKG